MKNSSRDNDDNNFSCFRSVKIQELILDYKQMEAK